MITRRELLTQGIAASALSVLDPTRLFAAETAPATTLAVRTRSIDVNGKAATVYGLVQPTGAHGLITRAGARFRVRLENHIDEPTLVHWHGLTPPLQQDGMPGFSQPPLEPGRAYDYDFPLDRAGTFWMHSHLGLQKQKLLAAPLIIHDPADAGRDEQEVVMILHDFTFREPGTILDDLTGGRSSTGHGAAHGTPSSSHGGHAGHGSAAPAQTRGGRPHFNDVEFDAYLANDRTLDDPEVVRVEPGGRIRLRIINAAAATNFMIDLDRLDGELTAVDGNAVVPVRGSRFGLATAQRIDVRLTLPAGQGAVPVFAIREGDVRRTGIVLATSQARVARLEGRSSRSEPGLDLAQETQLRAVLPLVERSANRTHRLDLVGGHSGGYRWSFAGAALPLEARHGERVHIVLRNATDMAHPMHLHGHRFQVIAIDGRGLAGAVRDTVLVPTRQAVTIAFDADNPGEWAFHCHHLYHMVAGMMTTLRYDT